MRHRLFGHLRLVGRRGVTLKLLQGLVAGHGADLFCRHARLCQSAREGFPQAVRLALRREPGELRRAPDAKGEGVLIGRPRSSPISESPLTAPAAATALPLIYKHLDPYSLRSIEQSRAGRISFACRPTAGSDRRSSFDRR